MAKNPGYLVTTEMGKKGRTLHSDGKINGKVPVYIKGEKMPILCDMNTLKITGFID